MKKRGLLSWVLEFAGRKRAYFGGSVVLAMLGVAASFIPYLIIADIVGQLLSDKAVFFISLSGRDVQSLKISRFSSILYLSGSLPCSVADASGKCTRTEENTIIPLNYQIKPVHLQLEV